MVVSYQGKLSEPEREAYPVTETFMSTSFTTVKPETDIYQAMEILLKNQVSGAMVVDEFNSLVGIVSEKDCLKLATEDSYQQHQPGGPVANYMTKEVVTIDASTGLTQVAQMFLEFPYKKLPVLKQGRLVGVVRRRDVLAAIRDFYGKRTEYLRMQ